MSEIDVEHESVFSRVDDIFESQLLFEKRVAVFGVGSLGSFCVEELVRCGVGEFRLVDFDRLEAHNIARHTCDLRDLGKLKTAGVAERVLAVNPEATIKAVEADICASPAVVDEILADADLGLVCTDNNASRFLVNSTAVALGVPVIYAGAYERGFGGHILRCVPRETPCYECVIGGVMATLGDLPEPKKGAVPYLGAGQENEFVAEPGLGLDVRFIALIQAKMALLTLLRGTSSKLVDFPSDLVFWGNQKEWIFPEPLYAQFASTSYRKGCSACGGRQEAEA